MTYSIGLCFRFPRHNLSLGWSYKGAQLYRGLFSTVLTASAAQTIRPRKCILAQARVIGACWPKSEGSTAWHVTNWRNSGRRISRRGLTPNPYYRRWSTKHEPAISSKNNQNFISP